MVDQMIGLSTAAAATGTLRLGTGVCLVPEHHPIDLAKRIATIDLFSGGRFILGVGAGWSPEESAAMGASFGRRWAQTREAIAVMKTLWTQEEPEFHGDFYDFPPVRFYPKPAQTPHPPVLLGGSSKYLFQRIASWADGWIPIGITPDDLRAGRAEIARLCESKGRDPDTVDVTIYGIAADSESIDAFRAAGADRATISVNPSGEADPSGQLEAAALAAGL
jgi:probable F420-dependent oxidoreductase